MAFIGNTNITQAFTPAIDYFSGNASTTAFTLSRPVASVAQVQVNISNVPQNPSDAYTVSGNTITFTSAPPSGTNNIYVYYTSPITQVIAPSQGTVGTTQIQNGVTVNFADGTAAAPSITNDGDTNTGIFFPAADTIAFAEGGAEVARFDSSGNLGIGTNSPKMKLNAEGTYGNPVTSGATPTGIARLSQTTNNVTLDFGVTTGNRVWMQGADKGDLSFTYDVVINPNGGNVGIGTSSPSYKLDVRSSLAVLDGSANIGFYANGTSFTQVWQTFQSPNDLLIKTTAAKYIAFLPNSTEAMRIDSSGNFFVGTTGTFSGAKINFRRTGSGQVLSIVTSITSGTNDMMAFLDGDENVCGYIQANTTANTLSYNTSSDYRLKDNIQSMTGGLAKVMQLKPSTWNWKSAPEVSGQGFIAHELQAIVPDAVCGVKDELYADGNPKFQGIDTSFLVATLTAAIQEQQALITALTARIEALENK